jgi:hypothetical protein
VVPAAGGGDVQAGVVGHQLPPSAVAWREDPPPPHVEATRINRGQ